MNVAMLAGGRTPERDVSLRSGHRVMGAFEELGHRATVIDPGEVALAELLIDDPPDVCYLTLHGRKGKTARSSASSRARDRLHGHGAGCST